jgi:hypothetical protein
MLQQDDSRGWQRMMAILSLDRVTPVLKQLEIPASPARDLQLIFRKVLLKYRDVLPEDRPGTPSNMVSDCMQEVVTKFGRDAAKLFYRWLEHVYFATEDTEYRSWRLVLIRLVRDEARWRSIGIPAEKSEKLRKLCEEATQTNEELESSLAASHAKALSDWDLAIYTLFGFDDEDNDPLASVAQVLRRMQFMRRWQKLERQTSPQEQQALVKVAQEVGHEMSRFAKIDKLDSAAWPS